MEQPSAKQILITHGRGYLYKQKYPQVVVFTKSVMDVDKLMRTYGGNCYKHRSGMIWMVSSKKRLREMLKMIAPTRSAHNFEDVICPFLGDL